MTREAIQSRAKVQSGLKHLGIDFDDVLSLFI